MNKKEWKEERNEGRDHIRVIRPPWDKPIDHFDGLAQDCSNSSGLAMELLQSWDKLSICDYQNEYEDCIVSMN